MEWVLTVIGGVYILDYFGLKLAMNVGETIKAPKEHLLGVSNGVVETSLDCLALR